MYIKQILDWFSEPHTYREMIDKFGLEKRNIIRKLRERGYIEEVGFTQSRQRYYSEVRLFQSTGKEYIRGK